MNQVEQSNQIAKDKYSELDVDIDKALEILREISISLHC